MRRNKHLVELAIAVAIAATAACAADRGVEPPPSGGSPSPDPTRVADRYRLATVAVPSGTHSVATNLSDSGVVVGWDIAAADYPGSALPPVPVVYDANGYTIIYAHPFAWSEHGGYRRLGGDSTGSALFATAINSAGVIVGARASVDSLGSGIVERPVRWSAAGSLETLPLPPGASQARAIDIGDDGTILLIAPNVDMAWIWRDNGGYAPVMAAGAMFHGVRLTQAGVAGWASPSRTPIIVGAGGEVIQLNASVGCVNAVFSHSGATVANCSGTNYLWLTPTSSPIAIPSPPGGVLSFTRISDGGIAAGTVGQTASANAYGVLFADQSGVVDLSVRLAAVTTLTGPFAAINASGALLFGGGTWMAGVAPFILIPQ